MKKSSKTQASATLYSHKETKKVIQREVNYARSKGHQLTRIRRFMCPEEQVGSALCLWRSGEFACDLNSKYVTYIVGTDSKLAFCATCAATLFGVDILEEDWPPCEREGCSAKSVWRTRSSSYCDKHIPKNTKHKQSLEG